MCKRKKKRRIKWAKSKRKKSKFNASHHKCKSIQCKSKVQSPIQTKSKSLKSTLRTVGHFMIIKPFSTLKTTATHYNHKSPLTRGIVQIINKNYDGLIPKGYVGSLFSRSDPILRSIIWFDSLKVRSTDS